MDSYARGTPRQSLVVSLTAGIAGSAPAMAFAATFGSTCRVPGTRPAWRGCGRAA